MTLVEGLFDVNYGSKTETKTLLDLIQCYSLLNPFVIYEQEESL